MLLAELNNGKYQRVKLSVDWLVEKKYFSKDIKLWSNYVIIYVHEVKSGLTIEKIYENLKLLYF